MYTSKLNLKSAIILAVLLLTITGCKKKITGCTNKDAINYNPKVNVSDEQSCIYPINVITGQYTVWLTSYPLQPSAVGESLDMTMGGGLYCPGTSAGGWWLEINSITAPVDPDDLCVSLNGFNFTITDSMNVYWAGAHLTGSGVFAKDSLTFTGTVTQSDGTKWPMVLKGHKYS